jgi:hypothetical protein
MYGEDEAYLCFICCKDKEWIHGETIITQDQDVHVCGWMML